MEVGDQWLSRCDKAASWLWLPAMYDRDQQRQNQRCFDAQYRDSFTAHLKEFQMIKKKLIVGGVIAAGVIGVNVYISRPHFSKADVTALQDTIRNEFKSREGVEVVDVNMMQIDDRKLTGFAKLKIPILGEITQQCEAQMGEDGRYIWSCKP